MRLSYRSARPHEFAPCFDLMCDSFAYPVELRAKVPELWAQWLKQNVMTAHVIEDHRDSGQAVIVGLGACVFVRDAFVAEYRLRRRPYVRAELARRTLAGETIVLTPEMMREQQRAGGLTLLFVNDPTAHRGLSEAEKLQVDAKWSEALYELRGCNIKAMWHEVYGSRAMRRSEGCGQLLYADWQDDGDTAGMAAVPEEERPFFMGVTREQAAVKPGTHASFLFMHVPPRFGFTVRQQEMLNEAMQGATDDELAGHLNVSSSTIKKRWVSVYERVSAAMPGWLDGAGESGDARGAEKRRHLLNYLRQHPEELHPACASRD